MAREFSRHSRVSAQMQREIAVLIQSQLKDPRLGFVTINEVEVTRDLSLAKVYFSVLNGDEAKIRSNLTVLTEAAAFIRRQLGRSMKMRSIPELRFVYDDSVERGMRMDALLKDVKASEEAEQDAGDDGA